MPRGQFDALELGLADGERVHVFGRAELYEQRGELRLKALTIERFGLGAHLAALERLKRKLAAEGLFDDERKRAAAALPAPDRARHRQRRRREAGRAHAHRAALPARERRSSRRRTCRDRARRSSIATAIGDLCRRGADVIVLARGGGSFEDLLPFSDERVVRAVAGVRRTDRLRGRARAGHAAVRSGRRRARLDADCRRARSSCPIIAELRAQARARARRVCIAARSARSSVTRSGSATAHDRLSRAPLLALERRSARASTRCTRGSARSARSRRSSAATRSSTAATEVVRSAGRRCAAGDAIDVRVAEGTFGATVG